MTLSTAVDASAVARVLGIQTVFKDLRGGQVINLPQSIGVVGQGATASTYTTTKAQYTSAFDVGTAYGFGSPIHLAAMQLFPSNGDGVGTIPVWFYPLEDDGSGVAAAGDITPGAPATADASYIFRINNIDSTAVTITASDSVATMCTAITAAINAVVEMPVVAVDSTTTVDFTSKWKGASANDIYVEVVGTSTSVTFAITQATGGLVNPDVDTALDQVGDVWQTMFLNCMEIADTTSLGKYSTFGEGRWGALVRKPCVVFTGNTEAVVATAITVSDARKTDRTNSQLVAPGSNDLPFVVAARQLARIAVVANNNPPVDYGSRAATGLTPGTDAQQWTYAQQDQAVKGGSSTVIVKDSVINIGDVVTFYHPSGDPTPAYRYVVDIVKLQNIIFNLDLIFNTAEWDGAPLIPDDQPTSNRSAKKPKTAVAAVAALVDNLGLAAIISDPATAKASIQAEIDSTNPKRLNLVVTVQLSGNTNIKSIDLEFGFYFGTSAIVA
jgi:phage tail sheath gpL-like